MSGENQGGDGTCAAEELYGEILAFLTRNLALEERRQCTSIVLFFVAGKGFRDEQLCKWIRDDEPEMFTDFVNAERIASTILEIAEGEAEGMSSGKQRFVVMARQPMGGRETYAFDLSPISYNDVYGSDLDPDVDRVNDGRHDPRKRLLARVAGNIASGIVGVPSKSTSTGTSIAAVAVDIAEEILTRAGL
jgi:hypothetical protein